MAHFNEAITHAYQYIRGANEEQKQRAENSDVAVIAAAYTHTVIRPRLRFLLCFECK